MNKYNCTICGDSVSSSAKTTILTKQRDLAYLKYLKVDDYWITVFEHQYSEKSDCICTACWLKFINTAINCTSFGIIERSRYIAAMKEEIAIQLKTCDDFNKEASNTKAL